MATELHLLGPPCIVHGDGRKVTLRGHKAWGLLAYLALRPSAAGRSHLAGLLFADAEDPLAALRWNLSELRRALGADTLRGDPLVLPRKVLSVVDLDVLAQGRWQEGLALPGLGGELLEGQHFSGCAAFQVWLDGQRRHAAALTSALLREAALAKLAAGGARDAAALARRLLELDPLDENAHVLLVRCLAASGAGIEAARQAAACRKLLQRELGISPGPALDEALGTATAMPTHAAVSGRGAVHALLEAGEAALRAGALEAGLQCLRRAIADADALRDPMFRKRARVSLGGALVHSARGRDEEGAAALHESLEIAHETATEIDAAACRELGYVEFLAGRYERALAWLARAEPLAEAVRAEQARIATVRGAVLSDQAHYGKAIEQLRRAADLARQIGDLRQSLYAESMIGRVLLLTGEFEAAAPVLERTAHEARHSWTAFLPWPEALAAELDLEQGAVDRAAERFEQAFALGCQLGDACWEGLAGRGLARVATARGELELARELLLDAQRRATRVPDSYLWGRVYGLDTLCALEVSLGCAEADEHIDEMLHLAQRSGMHELTVRAYLHGAVQGREGALPVAMELARDIRSATLSRAVDAAAHRLGAA